MTGRTLRTALAVLAGACLLMWPAWMNGYPFLFPDSIGYLSTARLVLPAFLHPGSYKVPADLRSEMYALGMGLLHWDRTPWPVVVFGALATSYVVWLVVRSVAPRKWARGSFLLVTSVLAVTTAAGWFVSAVLADVLAAVTYLALALLLLFRDRLSKGERWVVAGLAWFGMSAHMTHLLVAGLLCALLVVPMLAKWERLQVSRASWMTATAVVLCAVFCQLAMHRFLYGKATLSGNFSPPYLMARIIADGPGKMYLWGHCAEHDWEICRHVAELPSTDDEFLWKVGGIYNLSTDEQRKRLSAEQTPLLLATLRTYPRAQAHASLRNFWNQLTSFGLADFEWPIGYTPMVLDGAIPGSRERYLATRQANRTLPAPLFERVQQVAVIVALVVTVVLLPVAWWKRRNAMVGFTTVIGLALVLNAAVCGVISGVYPRYEARVMWMLVLMAMLLLVDVSRARISAARSIS